MATLTANLSGGRSAWREASLMALPNTDVRGTFASSMRMADQQCLCSDRSSNLALHAVLLPSLGEKAGCRQGRLEM